MMIEVSRFLNGINIKDEAAWKELYRCYYASLCSYSFKITGDRDVAQDVVQSCFIKLWDSSFLFPDIKAITAYMYRTVYHGSLNTIRDKKSSKSVHCQWFANVLRNEDDAVHNALGEEVISHFYMALYELPEQQREILLCTLRGEKVKDIAQKLSISENSVKTHKKRAYLYLRERLHGVLGVILTLLFFKK